MRSLLLSRLVCSCLESQIFRNILIWVIFVLNFLKVSRFKRFDNFIIGVKFWAMFEIALTGVPKIRILRNLIQRLFLLSSSKLKRRIFSYVKQIVIYYSTLLFFHNMKLVPGLQDFMRLILRESLAHEHFLRRHQSFVKHRFQDIWGLILPSRFIINRKTKLINNLLKDRDLYRLW